MPAAPADVVLTGVGVFSPIGIGPAAFWESLAAGRSGVAEVAQFVAGRMPVSFGSEVRGFDPREHVRPRKSIKVMSREIQLGFAAADQAFTDAGLAPGALPPERLGVVFGADMIYDDFADLEGSYRRCRVDGRFVFDRWAESAATELYPLWLLKQLPNMVASHVAIHLDARGPNNTIVIGETSSLQALAEAASVIRRGRADVMVVGGTGCRLHLGALLFRGDSILSHRNDDCTRASRPFDLHRDGMVNGEGAAAVVIESAEHARRRGATIRGRLVAAAARCERRPGREAPPAGHALRAALAAVLDQAGLRPADVSHVNAHGLSTVAEDRSEAGAIAALLDNVPVTAPKSFFGHLGAAGALVELLASLLGAERGLVPPTINYETPDPACPLRVVHGGPAPYRPGPIVKLSAARTGQAAAAVIAPPAVG